MKFRLFILFLASSLILTSCKTGGWNNFNKRKHLNLKHQKVEEEVTTNDDVLFDDDPSVLPESSSFDETDPNGPTSEKTNTLRKKKNSQALDQSVSLLEENAYEEIEDGPTADRVDSGNSDPVEVTPTASTDEKKHDDKLSNKKIRTYETLALIAVVLLWAVIIFGLLALAGVYFPAYAFLTSAFIATELLLYFYWALGLLIFFSIFFTLKARSWTRKAKKKESTKLQVLSVLTIIFTALGIAGFISSIVVIILEFF